MFRVQGFDDNFCVDFRTNCIAYFLGGHPHPVPHPVMVL